jgi:hypothetical protein
MKIAVAPPVESLIADPLTVGAAHAALMVPGRTIREKLDRLETILKAGETIELPVKHHFARGVYAREMFIPKGIVVVGRVHKYSQISICSRGDISVLTEAGIKRVQAGAHIVAPAGIKRAVYTHEDTVFTTICHTHTRDADLLLEELTFARFEDYDRFCAALAHEEQP